MARIVDKVVLAVGGAKDIGLAIAKWVAIEGASVVLTIQRADELEADTTRIERGALALVADAARQQDLHRVAATVRETQGRIDALVLNPGISEPATLRGGTPEHFDRHFAVNVRGLSSGCRRRLARWCGAVVLVSSIADVIGVALSNLCRHEGGSAFLRAHVDSGTGPVKHPHERGRPRSDRKP